MRRKEIFCQRPPLVFGDLLGRIVLAQPSTNVSAIALPVADKDSPQVRLGV